MTSSDVQCFPKFGDSGSALGTLLVLAHESFETMRGQLTHRKDVHNQSQYWIARVQFSCETACVAQHDRVLSILDAASLVFRGSHDEMGWRQPGSALQRQ